MACVFVDLDRTLLGEGSGPAIGRALEAAGLPTSRLRFPGDELWWAYYRRFGETPLSMAMARASVLATKGWDVEQAQRAAHLAVPALLEQLAPGAPGALEAWREEGHRIVIVTTTPEHLVAPFAAALGVDGVLATRYEQRDGAFTGGIEGGFVWGTGKLDAVRAYCAREGLDLAACIAVSDSIFDLPLLRAAGGPLIVNPDPSLAVLSRLLRWPIAQWSVAGGVPKVLGVEPFGLVRHLVVPQLFPYARFDIEGLEHVPEEGPVVLAVNHRSYFDVAVLLLLAARLARPVRALAKRELFDVPLLADGAARHRRAPCRPRALRRARLRRGGRVAPARRGRHRAAPGDDPARRRVLRAGARGPHRRGPPRPGERRVGRSRRALGHRARLAPDRAAPDVTTLRNPREVTVRVGEPVAFHAEDPKAATEELMAAIVALLPQEARVRREATEEELARTFPRWPTGRRCLRASRSATASR